MNDDEGPTSTAAERIAALNARRAAGGVVPGRRSHPARGARRATLIASVAAVAGLTSGFALNSAGNFASTSVTAAGKTAATKPTATKTTATTSAAGTMAGTPGTTTPTSVAATTSQGS